MKIERSVQLLKEIRALKRRLAIVERQAEALQKTKAVSPREAFRRKYPHLSLDPRLVKLVGIDPPLSIAEEKKAVREILAARLART